MQEAVRADKKQPFNRSEISPAVGVVNNYLTI